MGIIKWFSDCDCSGDQKPAAQKLPNPDPRNFNIVKSVQLKQYLAVWVNYPDCTNYEGNKIMVFRNVEIDRLKQSSFLDPHFCDADHFSPIARFVPTDEGWQMARDFAKTLSR